MKKYIYSGLPSHPCDGMVCTIGWKFDHSDNYLVYFVEDDPRGIGFEVADMTELEQINGGTDE